VTEPVLLAGYLGATPHALARLPLGEALPVHGWTARPILVPLPLAAADLATATREEALLGAALIPREWLPGRAWMAFEWRGALVVARELAAEVDTIAAWWAVDRRYEHPEVVVLRPRELVPVAVPDDGPRIVESTAEYRDALLDEQPAAMRVDLRHLLADPTAWFGELADERLGGAVALMVLSGARRGGESVLLRNAAALELTTCDRPSHLARASLGGSVAVRGWGVSGTWDSARLPARADRARRASAFAAAGETRFGVYLEVQALVDPELELDDGTVLEQYEVNDVQTLAAAQPRSISVDAGDLEPLAVPAWCLNRRLAPPNGEPVRPTPLRLTRSYDSQYSLWDDRDRLVPP
jgi:hypothetical protein